MIRFPIGKLSLGIAGALVSVSLAQAADYTFTFAHVLTEQTPNARAAVKFKEEVEKNSNGRIEINVRPAAQLGGDVEIIEQTQMGLVHIAIPPTGNLANFEPKMFLFDLPYLIKGEQSMKQLLDGEVGRELLGTLEKSNLHGVNYWGAGFRNITNNIREINQPDDLKNIKMRTLQAPTILATYRAWGANPTAMAYTEVYNGLQQGVVEGQENPLANIDSMKFYEVQKYLSITNHVYSPWIVTASKKWWDGLSADERDVLLKAAAVSRDFERKDTRAEADKALAQLKADGMQVNTVSPEAVQKMRETIAPVNAQIEKSVGPDLWNAVQTQLKDIRKKS